MERVHAPSGQSSELVKVCYVTPRYLEENKILFGTQLFVCLLSSALRKPTLLQKNQPKRLPCSILKYIGLLTFKASFAFDTIFINIKSHDKNFVLLSFQIFAFTLKTTVIGKFD